MNLIKVVQTANFTYPDNSLNLLTTCVWIIGSTVKTWVGHEHMCVTWINE